MSNCIRERKAFTLIEVPMVISIIILLAATMIVMFQKVMEYCWRRAAEAEIQQMLDALDHFWPSAEGDVS